NLSPRTSEQRSRLEPANTAEQDYPARAFFVSKISNSWIIMQNLNPRKNDRPGAGRDSKRRQNLRMERGCVRSTSRSNSKAGGVGHVLSGFMLPALRLGLRPQPRS